jgi:hypothetical protein
MILLASGHGRTAACGSLVELAGRASRFWRASPGSRIRWPAISSIGYPGVGCRLMRGSSSRSASALRR